MCCTAAGAMPKQSSVTFRNHFKAFLTSCCLRLYYPWSQGHHFRVLPPIMFPLTIPTRSAWNTRCPPSTSSTRSSRTTATRTAPSSSPTSSPPSPPSSRRSRIRGSASHSTNSGTRGTPSLTPGKVDVLTNLSIFFCLESR